MTSASFWSAFGHIRNGLLRRFAALTAESRHQTAVVIESRSDRGVPEPSLDLLRMGAYGYPCQVVRRLVLPWEGITMM